LGFAHTVDDFMDQFYKFKSHLMRIGFLRKDAHFAFNLSNINNAAANQLGPTARRNSKLLNSLEGDLMHQIFAFLDHQEELIYLNLLCKHMNNSIKSYWPLKAFSYEWRVS
jgi:hypothetical protein